MNLQITMNVRWRPVGVNKNATTSQGASIALATLDFIWILMAERVFSVCSLSECCVLCISQPFNSIMLCTFQFSAPTTHVLEPSISSSGTGPEETPTGDHESMSLTSTGSILSSVIVSTSTLPPTVSSLVFVVVMPSSVSHTDATSTTELTFLPESSSSTLHIVSSGHMYTSSSGAKMVSEGTNTAVVLSSSELHKQLRTSAYLGHTISEDTLLVSTHMYSSSSTAVIQVSDSRPQTSVLTSTAATASSELLRVHTTSSYNVSEQPAITSSASATFPSPFLSITSGSFYTTVPLMTSPAATSLQPVPTPFPTTSHFTVISSSVVAYTTVSSSPVPISSRYATQPPPAPSQVITVPQETSKAEPRTTDSGATTDSLPKGIEVCLHGKCYTHRVCSNGVAETLSFELFVSTAVIR